MALIRNSKPQNSTGNYERLLGNKELGLLITKIHSSSVSSGSELESIIVDLLKKESRVIHDIDDFLENISILDNHTIYLLTKKILQKSKSINHSTINPDFLVFERKEEKRHCYIIELKDGHVFDTKKASKEKENLQKFQNSIASCIQYTTSIHICAFNNDSKKEIIKGLKNCFSEEEILTGKELCQLLNINYDHIIKMRQNNSEDNLKYVLHELYHIEEIRNFFKDNL